MDGADRCCVLPGLIYGCSIITNGPCKAETGLADLATRGSEDRKLAGAGLWLVSDKVPALNILASIMSPKKVITLDRLPGHGGKMDQMGMPLLGVVLAALCLLLAGLGAVLHRLLARRRLKRLRAEYEVNKCAHLEAQRRADSRSAD